MNQHWPFSGLIRHSALRERLIVSLDFGGPREAIELVEVLVRHVRTFKVGRLLYRNGGPDFIRDLRRRGAEIFLDLKFHDSAHSVSKAAVEATRLGVRMFDLHPQGSRETMERTRAEVNRICRAEGLRRPHILAVAMLASLPVSEPAADRASRVVDLAKLAASAALDGVFTSPAETAEVRAACGRRFIIVTSGFRPGPILDGCEIAGPADTLRLGADYIVVGGPIWRAAEPGRVVREILEEMERGMRTNSRNAIEIFSSRSL